MRTGPTPEEEGFEREYGTTFALILQSDIVTVELSSSLRGRIGQKE